MARLDPNHINQVYTYNAPGFDTAIIGSDDTEWFFNAVGYAQTQTESSTTVASGFPTAKLHNLAIELDVISDIGTIPGEQIFQFGEASDRVEAHKIGGPTDALAISNLINSLSVDTNLSLSQIETYLKAASNQADESLEKTINIIGDLLNAGTTVATDDRNELYTRISAIEGKNLTGQLRFQSVESLAGDADKDTPQGI